MLLLEDKKTKTFLKNENVSFKHISSEAFERKETTRNFNNGVRHIQRGTENITNSKIKQELITFYISILLVNYIEQNISSTVETTLEKSIKKVFSK